MKTLMDILKSSMTSLYESLLDDEEELIDSIDLNNIFEQISSAKSLKEFTKYFDILLNLCTKYTVSELTPEQRLELDKDKKSLYICQMYGWNNQHIIYINRIFKYTSKFSVAISPREMAYNTSQSFYVVCQTQKVKPSPFYKHVKRGYIFPTVIYKIPDSLMKAFKEWYEKYQGTKFLQSYQSI